ncbi:MULTISPECIES: PTS sugar transporter subunit IIA [Peribacillus]|uniref:PTS sugar transporter subunit IIA n=1 Tax=Peribacillus TaxID=2675229 RepID=UPI001F4D6836|nr:MULTISPECIES: PTS sugar transporter subunit IIA [unclassified Peribacillus]MCK1982600.1 PTS sugar transporter subunit IIA [Peribacillus sp. Aquil_B1]MCK2008109.1 PTS sugar transporter subunit IIA [Peribacillus sp. Aquil_B8]
MIGIVLTGHGSFPTGMLESVQLIAGEVKQVEVIPFEEDVSILEQAVSKAIDNVETGAGVVCFTDLAGGTPFNVCSTIASCKDNIRVIAGTNLPMLLSGLFHRELSLEAFIEKMLKDGKENIMEFKKIQKQIEEDVAGI